MFTILKSIKPKFWNKCSRNFSWFNDIYKDFYFIVVQIFQKHLFDFCCQFFILRSILFFMGSILIIFILFDKNCEFLKTIQFLISELEKFQLVATWTKNELASENEPGRTCNSISKVNFNKQLDCFHDFLHSLVKIVKIFLNFRNSKLFHFENELASSKKSVISQGDKSIFRFCYQKTFKNNVNFYFESI